MTARSEESELACRDRRARERGGGGLSVLVEGIGGNWLA